MQKLETSTLVGRLLRSGGLLSSLHHLLLGSLEALLEFLLAFRHHLLELVVTLKWVLSESLLEDDILDDAILHCDTSGEAELVRVDGLIVLPQGFKLFGLGFSELSVGYGHLKFTLFNIKADLLRAVEQVNFLAGAWLYNTAIRSERMKNIVVNFDLEGNSLASRVILELKGLEVFGRREINFAWGAKSDTVSDVIILIARRRLLLGNLNWLLIVIKLPDI